MTRVPTHKTKHVDRWTLSNLNGRNLVYVAEGAGITNLKMVDVVKVEKKPNLNIYSMSWLVLYSAKINTDKIDRNWLMVIEIDSY